MKRKQDIVGIHASDLLLICNFTENYSKHLANFINSTFEYDDFKIESNGISIEIILFSKSEIKLIFNKKTIKHKTELKILSLLFENQINDCYHNYVSFTEMLTRIKEKLSNDVLYRSLLL